uniref:Transmembrane protein 107 n=2 Tax=Octopus bimaculoides TaxID=37653 RepID=A0A0L8H1K1_OCTBM
MNRLSYVIPARFLILVAHFVTVVMITLSRERNVMQSLPLSYTPEEYSSKQTE